VIGCAKQEVKEAACKQAESSRTNQIRELCFLFEPRSIVTATRDMQPANHDLPSPVSENVPFSNRANVECVALRKTQFTDYFNRTRNLNQLKSIP
jgi:hypothetical protein